MNEEKIEYEYYTVDFDGVNSRYTMYDKIKEGLDFPDYFGANLSAIWDCLTDMVYHGVTITLENFDLMEKYDKKMSEKLLEIFKRSKHFGKDTYYNTYKIYVVRNGEKTELL